MGEPRDDGRTYAYVADDREIAAGHPYPLAHQIKAEVVMLRTTGRVHAATIILDPQDGIPSITPQVNVNRVCSCMFHRVAKSFTSNLEDK